MYFMIMDEFIKMLIVNEIGEKCDDIICPQCQSSSKPIGLGKKDNHKIQLVRKCRNCNNLFWYWIDFKNALTPFGEN